MAMTIEQANKSMPFAESIGVEFINVDDDVVRARLAWSEECCTAGGAMHGGAIMALADATGALLAFMNLPDGAFATTTVASATNFVRGVRDGYATAEATLLHRGRTTIVVETTIIDDAGKTVAKVTQTQAVLS